MQQLEALRQLMRKKGVDAVIIPGTDPHQSEYPAQHYKFRDYITGFTGSNGTAVVTLNGAALWTDSRYFLQAERQLQDSGFELMRENGDNPSPTYEEWLAESLAPDDIIAINGRLFSTIDANRFERFCGENGFRMATDFDPAGDIWAARPPRPLNPAYPYDEQLAGETVDSKISRTLEIISQNDADAMLVAGLDEIAWLFNIRGADIERTPVTIAYAYIAEDDCNLFIDSKKITPELADHLKRYHVRTRDYDDITRFLERRSTLETVLLDPKIVSDTLANAHPGAKLYATSPVNALKAIKNEAQISGIRQAMERDGAALVRLHMWLEQNVPTGDLTEIDVATQAAAERAKEDKYTDESFDLIAGYADHGAIVHYQATPETAATLRPEGLLLIDSGGQYLDGTTDITRTITLGNPTEQQRRDYTTVLRGHLALQGAHFPEGTTGAHLDALARMPLWKQGLTYWHGTGHGVGHFLSCHEGPQSIRNDQNPTPLRPGMVVSDEPGLYRTGQYGIRIENLLLVVEAEQTESFGTFLAFEPLTLFPYDRRLIDTALLTREEIRQINDYHAIVAQRLLPHLNPEQAQWLQAQTAPL